jgi:alpha-glucosidase
VNAKRAVTLFVALAVAALVACTEEKKNQTLHPYSGGRDAGADSDFESDATADTGAPIVDTGIDTAPAFVDTFISDLAFTGENGYGPVEKNTSNGEDAANDGVMMMIEGVMYAKGLGVHAPSKVTIALGGQYKTFLADVGVDDEVMADGTVVFRVVVDGAELFNSNTMTGNDAAKPVSVDVTGKNTLELFVDDAADGIGSDHADWANARLRK